VLVVDEPEPVDADRDVVLIFDDWWLRPDGALEDSSFRAVPDAANPARSAEHLTLNGRPTLDLPVRANERLRLRLVNAAADRLIAVRVDQHRPIVMAIDGQAAEPFAARDARVVLGPGNRVDLFVDATLAPGATAPILLETGTAQAPIGRLVYERMPARAEPRPEPKSLPQSLLPQRMDFAQALRIDLPLDPAAMRPPSAGAARKAGEASRTRLWASSSDAAKGTIEAPLFRTNRGRTVTMAFANRTAFPHALHLHGHHFRLLDALDDGWKPFWLDTLVVSPNQTARIAFVADNPGKWLLQCQPLEHAAAGTSAWFEVT
jgi:FtsP/CotA-like multicopper oxidase with cupredoxin domain